MDRGDEPPIGGGGGRKRRFALRGSELLALALWDLAQWYLLYCLMMISFLKACQIDTIYVGFLALLVDT
ncbi:hypothetical protein L873DRAFT_1824120 [Choiromyces venosus 120613-1]|uniref:Uncharacterized protein n=1 Tax=Choiromyces venosus 120613-1 TaxID=1336337 RepID=A0A3N4IWQ5_9PEZI|nr:hypothetical protein L873DRAFT_1824120 [Choiromyces venosus 120613-1]